MSLIGLFGIGDLPRRGRTLTLTLICDLPLRGRTLTLTLICDLPLRGKSVCRGILGSVLRRECVLLGRHYQHDHYN